jgi:hypothetical protein
MLAISSYTFCVTVSSAEPGMKKYMNMTATVPNANAIGMPENMTISVAMPYREPITVALIGASLFNYVLRIDPSLS